MKFALDLLLAAGVLILGLSAPPALAQDAGEVQELQRVIDDQQRQLEAQQAQLDAQGQLLLTLQEQIESLAAEPAAKSPAAIVVAEEPEGRRLSTQHRHDLEVPTGSSVQYSRPAVTLMEPNTKTRVGIHGFAEFQIIHDTNGSNNNEFDTFMIPVPEGDSQTKYSVNPSRLGFTSNTPLDFGRLNVLVSMDLNGELDVPEPRLREAYGEFIHDDLDFAVLAGQTFSTMLNLKSVPETLDFAGPTGYFARRQPLLRFTKMFKRQLFLDIATDTPENSVFLDRPLPGGEVSTASRQTQWPDFVVGLAWDDEENKYLDNIRLIGLFRDLRAEDSETGTEGSTLGWAVGGSGKVNLPFLGAKDNFKFGVQYGEGYGGQLKSGPADALFDPVSLDLENIGVFSAYGGLQHWWTDTIRSNAVFGYVNADNPSFIGGDALENTSYFAANLVWNPWKSVTLGMEYLRGRRENVDGASGDANRIVFSSKWDFF
jgi:hypothetical protein